MPCEVGRFAALVIWFVGFLLGYEILVAGPGCSSVGVGAFGENGPFRPGGEVLRRNDYSWNKGIGFFVTLAMA